MTPVVESETLFLAVSPTQDENVPRRDRLDELHRINERVADVTEAAAEAATQALEAAKAAKRARKRTKAEIAKKRKARARVAAAAVAATVRPAQDADVPTEPDAGSSPETAPRTRHRRQNVISLRLGDDELARVKDLAAKTGLPVSASVRALIVQALDRAEGEQPGA